MAEVKRPLFLSVKGGFEEAGDNDTLPANPVTRPVFSNPTEIFTPLNFPILAERTFVKLQAEKYKVSISSEITGDSAGQGKQVGFGLDAMLVRRATDTKDVVTANAWMLVFTIILFDNSLAVIGQVFQGSKTFVVNGYDMSFLQPGASIEIEGSTGNNGTYTVVSSTFAAGNTSIIVQEPIPSPIADGSLICSIPFDFYHGKVAGSFTASIRNRFLIAEKIVEQSV